MIEADEVVRVLAVLEDAGVSVWVGGGWGIDALVGVQTRPHRDLDLMHRQEQEPQLLDALGAAGYVEMGDWRPVRFVLADAHGRRVDAHPLVFSPDGSATQSSFDPDCPFVYPADCFVTGTIVGKAVPCLSAQRQVDFHHGYEPTERDRQDMAHLRRAFGISTHF
jgi:lincosamide nucleotidyltransferase A/C/D/E